MKTIDSNTLKIMLKEAFTAGYEGNMDLIDNEISAIYSKHIGKTAGKTAETITEEKLDKMKQAKAFYANYASTNTSPYSACSAEGNPSGYEPVTGTSSSYGRVTW